MSDKERSIQLHGRVFLKGQIRLVTGLHIGAARTALSIGGLDNPVVREPLTDRPYIPGSSLKGKLRSLLEKQYGLPQNQSIGEGVSIHICKKPKRKDKEADGDFEKRLEQGHSNYTNCQVCPLFGVPGEDAFEPTRLVVRDVPLDEDSAEALQKARTGMPYTEVKWEAAIDRVTATATPRQMERVPAGAIFRPMELVHNLYQEADFDRFAYLLEALLALEDDYLGGLGSRGSGKVAFQGLGLTARPRQLYQQEETFGESLSLDELLAKKKELLDWLREKLPLS